MKVQLLTKKKTRAFALLGLLLIISMVVTSTVEGQALNDGEVTETIAVASDEFEDTVGDGVDAGTQEQEGTPTPDPSDVPGENEGAGEEGGGEDEPTPTDTPTEEPTDDGTGGEDESEGDESEGDQSEGDESEGDESESDESEGDESEGDESEGDESEGDESEGDESEDDESEGDELEGDQSEGDQSEGDESEGDQSEGDQSEGDESEGDESEGDESEGNESEEEVVQLSISVEPLTYDDVLDVVSFEVTIKNTGSVDAADIIVNVSTSPALEDGLVSPPEFNFGVIGCEEGSNVQSQLVMVSSPWSDGNTSLTLKASITGEGLSAEGTANKLEEKASEEGSPAVSLGVETQQEDRGSGVDVKVTCAMNGGTLKHKWTVENNYWLTKIRFKWSSSSGESHNSWITVTAGNSNTFYTNASAQTMTISYQTKGLFGWSSTKAITKSHEACDAVDLSLSIIDVDTTCFGVDVTVRVSNPSQYINATNIVIGLNITHGSQYISSPTSMSQSIASIAKSGSSEVTFSVVTDQDWIGASSSDWIGFTAAITSADQSDPSSGNNSDNDKAYNPGNCLPNLHISLTITDSDMCGEIDFSVSVSNSGQTSAVNVQVTNSITAHSSYVDNINPYVLNFGNIDAGSTATLTGTIITSDDWMKQTSHTHFTIKSEVSNEEANPSENVGKSSSKQVTNPGNCGPILDLWIVFTSSNLCGNIDFDVKVKNNGAYSG